MNFGDDFAKLQKTLLRFERNWPEVENIWPEMEDAFEDVVSCSRLA